MLKTSLSALFCFTTGLALGQDPLVPGHGDQRVDVRNYAINLTLGTDLSRINGTARLLLATTEPMREFSLDLRALTVSRVLVNGLPAQFRQADEKLHITPRFPLVAGVPADIAITYAGNPVPIPDPSYDWISVGWGKLGWQLKSNGNVTTMGYPHGASTWFPCNDWVEDRATYQIAITVPAGLTAVATGQPLPEVALPQGRRYSFSMSSPISPVMAGVSVGRYKIARSTSVSGIPLRVYMDPLASAKSVAFAQKHMSGSIDFFTKVFGRLPYSNCSLVTTGREPGGLGLLQTNSSMLTAHYLADDEVEGWPFEGVEVISGMASNMWFESVVMKYQDQWLNSGMWIYAQRLYQEHWSPTYDRNSDFAIFYDMLKSQEAEGMSLGPLILRQGDDWYSPSIFYRSALVIYALEKEIGREATAAILRSWLERYRNRLASTEDFINHVTSSTSDPDVRPLLMSWIYDTYMPPFPGAAAPAQALTAVKAASSNKSATQAAKLQRGAGYLGRR